jgi:hypothetical protein
VRFAAALVLLAACGGRTGLRGTLVDAGATTSDTVPCGEAGACAASTDYCLAESAGPGDVSYACTALPAGCHACSCASMPKAGMICTCTGDGDRITVSCRPF